MDCDNLTDRRLFFLLKTVALHGKLPSFSIEEKLELTKTFFLAAYFLEKLLPLDLKGCFLGLKFKTAGGNYCRALRASPDAFEGSG